MHISKFFIFGEKIRIKYLELQTELNYSEYQLQ